MPKIFFCLPQKQKKKEKSNLPRLEQIDLSFDLTCNMHMCVHMLFSPVVLSLDLSTLPMFLQPFQTCFLNLHDQSRQETLPKMLDNTSR